MCHLLFAVALSFGLHSPENPTRSYIEVVQQEYTYIPPASKRAEQDSGYRPYPEFPRLEIVKEGVDSPDPLLASLIQDPELLQQIEQGHFSSLLVQDLSLARAIPSGGDTTIVPFIVSIKYTRGANNWYNFSQGTIEAAGEITVRTNFQGRVSVEVSKFGDSKGSERLSRAFGYNTDINLNFARKVAVPVLENFFNSEPTRVAQLLQ